VAIHSDKNPIVIESAISASTKVTDNLIFIKSVYWYHPTTAGQLASLKDSNGNVIIPLRCESDGISQWFDINISVDGIYCDDLDSGTLYVYCR
jgi:hypothetical protein